MVIDNNIVADYLFESKFIEVQGSKLHYIDQGEGETFLFLHGMPSWSYLWRNIIPHVSKYARCLAVDLIGFGKSDQPNIDYTVQNHIRYLEEFIEKMGLKNITFVAHSWGSTFALHYASRFQSNVKQFIFMEPILKPFDRWEDFNPTNPMMAEIFKKFRTPGLGYELIVNQDDFIQHMGGGGNVRPLSVKEQAMYREPFEPPRNRLPLWFAPQQLPIANEPKEVVDLVQDYKSWLMQTEIPMLLFYVENGAFIGKDALNWCEQNIKNIDFNYLGEGRYWYIEDYPHTIGNKIVQWCNFNMSLPSACTSIF